MTTWRLRENTVGDLPGVATTDLPDPMPRGVSVVWHRGQLGLRPEGVAGSFTLANGDVCHVTPKVGHVALHRMLAVVHGDDAMPHEISLLGDTPGGGLPEAAARGFLERVEEALRRGRAGGRTRRPRTDTVARGPVDVRQTSRRLAARRPDPVVSHPRERTTDTPENRVVAAALQACQHLTPDARTQLRALQRRWGVPHGAPAALRDDVETVRLRLARKGYRGPRHYYEPLLRLALVVLGESAFDGEGSLRGDHGLVRMDSLFERYTRTVVRGSLVQHGCVVAKARPGEESLYLDGSQSLQPDIVVSRGEARVLLADAKYKDPTAADHYQMHAYLEHFGVPSGVLLTPADSHSETEPIVRRTKTGRRVVEIGLPLYQLDAAEDRLSRLLEYQ